MRVKKFEGASFEEALNKVKTEFGADALVLSFREEKRKWFQKPITEIVAGIKETKKVENKKEFVEEQVKKVFPYRRFLDDFSDLKSPKEEKENGIQKIEEMQPRYRNKQTPLEHVETEQDRKEEGKEELPFYFSSYFAKELLNRSKKIKNINLPSEKKKIYLELISNDFSVLSYRDWLEENSWCFIGASGSGKTSTLIKIGLSLKKQGRPVKIITKDVRKIVGLEEIRWYSKLSGIEVAKNSFIDRSEGILLIDTPAIDFEEIPTVYPISYGNKVCLVLDASWRLKEMLQLLEMNSIFSISAVVFTKIDFVRDPASLYDFLRMSKLPLLGISNSSSLQVPFHWIEKKKFSSWLIGMTPYKELNSR